MYWIWPQVETYSLYDCISLLEDLIVGLLLAMLFPFRGNALFRQHSFCDYQLQIKEINKWEHKETPFYVENW